MYLNGGSIVMSSEDLVLTIWAPLLLTIGILALIDKRKGDKEKKKLHEIIRKKASRDAERDMITIAKCRSIGNDWHDSDISDRKMLAQECACACATYCNPPDLTPL